MIIVISLAIIVVGIVIGCYVSKKKFDNNIGQLSSKSQVDAISLVKLQNEIDRIELLKNNLREIKENVDNLDIPTPENIGSNDDAQSSLNKLSCFFEEHTKATVGTEQLILSLLPTSQVGESLHSLAQIIPPDVGHAIFGDALLSLKEGLQSISTAEFLHRFAEGASHLSDTAMVSMKNALAHRDVWRVGLTPIKSGAMEALGINDAAHNIVSSLHDVGSEIMSSAATTVDVSDLVNVTDIDVAGHIPVITIALSSIREVQLLSDNKTDCVSSVKNISLDAAGTGGGAAVGAKAGAIVGSILGPGGAIVGGIIGGIGGAIGGRTLTNKIKTRPLKKAIKKYESEYAQMKSETEKKSRTVACNIQIFATDKRKEFQDSPVLKEVPIADTDQTVSQIALVLYQFVVNELIEMKTKTIGLRKSVWYSDTKYNSVINLIESEIDGLQKQLPPVEFIKNSPDEALDVILNLNMPNRKMFNAYQHRIDECSEELKTVNDKNNSSVLVWSYMVNNLYQMTLNDIADYSNGQIASLNETFNKWKEILGKTENRITVEKGKLGLS